MVAAERLAFSACLLVVVFRGQAEPLRPPPLCEKDRAPPPPPPSDGGLPYHLLLCDRPAPCVNHEYLTREHCVARPADNDWPALPLPNSTGELHRRRPDAPLSAERMLRELLPGKVLIMVGDSVMRNDFLALVCDVRRAGLDARDLDGWHGRQLLQPEPPAGALTPDEEAVNALLAPFYDRFLGARWGPPGLTDVHFRLVAVPQTRTLLGLLLGNWPDEHAVRAVADDVRADAVMLNYGLHHGECPNGVCHTNFEAEVTALFAQLAHTAGTPGRAVLWRDTTPQHFRDTGSYERWEQAHLAGTGTAGHARCACAPFDAEVEAKSSIFRLNQDAWRALRVPVAAAIQHVSVYAVLREFPYAHNEDPISTFAAEGTFCDWRVPGPLACACVSLLSPCPTSPFLDLDASFFMRASACSCPP